MASNLSSRILKAKNSLRKYSVQALLITTPENLTFLTGMTLVQTAAREAVGLLIQGKLFLILSPLADFKTKKEEPEINIRKAKKFSQEIRKICLKENISRLAFEKEDLRVNELQRLKREIAPVNLKAGPKLILSLRLIKDESELANIRKACRITVKVAKNLPKLLKPGKSEKEIAWLIEKLLREEGAEGIPTGFRPIAASASNSAIPHHTPSTRKLKSRDILLLDFGCTYAGYASDFTRAIFIGEPTPLQKKVSALVKKAQRKALQALRQTNNAGQVDRAARDFLNQAGYGKFFIHNTGHGIGLNIHEPPVLGPGAKTRLQPGMVVSVEPGVYLPGKFGIRYEDTVLIKKKGIEILTSE